MTTTCQSYLYGPRCGKPATRRQHGRDICDDCCTVSRCCERYHGGKTTRLISGNLCAMGTLCELYTKVVAVMPTTVAVVWQAAVDARSDADGIIANQHDDGHWTVGSNYEDRPYCLAYYPAQDAWFARAAWSGDDTPLTIDPQDEAHRLFS